MGLHSREFKHRECTSMKMTKLLHVPKFVPDVVDWMEKSASSLLPLPLGNLFMGRFPSLCAGLLSCFGFSWWCFPKSNDEALFQLIFDIPSKDKGRILWSNAIMTTLWKLWPGRNWRVFKEKRT